MKKHKLDIAKDDIRMAFQANDTEQIQALRHAAIKQAQHWIKSEELMGTRTRNGATLLILLELLTKEENNGNEKQAPTA